MLRSADPKVPSASPTFEGRHDLAERDAGAPDAYARYLLNCSDYLRRQMMIYEHWPQRRYDVLGYRDEKVFSDMNN